MPRIVEFQSRLKGSAKTRAGPTTSATAERAKAELTQAAGLFAPHLEKLPLDCTNCGGRAFVVVVSPLKDEPDGGAALQGVQCIKCAARYKIEDGVITGKRNGPVARIIRPPS